MAVRAGEPGARTFARELEAGYRDVFVRGWPPHVAALWIALICTWLLVSGRFRSVFGGLSNWGDWFNALVGLDGVLGIDAGILAPPWVHSI